LITAGVYALASRKKPNKKRSVGLSAVAGSLTNTVFYLGLMLLFYVMAGIDSEKVLTLIGGTGLIAGSLEAVVSALISTAVVAALWSVEKN
jgi:uncharacterized membrane protein